MRLIGKVGSMSETTSVFLLGRLQASSETRSWNQFCSIYQPFIRSWLGRLGLSEGDAADIEQEVMCVVIREMPCFRHNGSPGAFRCWLRRVTVNQLRSYRRSIRRQQRLGTDPHWLADSLADPDNELTRRFDHEHDDHLVRSLLATVRGDFSATTLAAFHRTTLDGVSAAEVAVELGLSKAAVIAAKSRVLCRLREEALNLFGNSRASDLD